MRIVKSRKLGDTIIIVADESAALRLNNPVHTVYTEREVFLLKDQPVEILKQCHEMKTVFGGFVQSVTRRRLPISVGGQPAEGLSGDLPSPEEKRLF